MDSRRDKILDKTSEDILKGIEVEIKTKYVTNFGAVEASGRLRKNLEIKRTENGFKVLILRYAYYLIIGRKPGKLPPIDVIKQWIQDKGLSLNPWAVAAMMKKKGSTIFQRYNPGESGLFQETIDKNLVEMQKEITVLYLGTATSDLLKGFD